MSDPAPSPPPPHAGDVRRLARGAGVQLAAKFGGRAGSFLTQLLLARWLGPAALGVWSVGTSLYLFTHLLASLGLDHGVIRFASRHHRRDPERLAAVVRQAIALTLFAGLAGSLLLLVFARPLALRVFDSPPLVPVLTLLAAGVAFAALLRVGAAASRVRQAMGASVLTEDLGQPLLFLAGATVVYLAGGGLLGVVGALVLSQVLAALAALWLLHRLFPGWHRPHARPAPARPDASSPDASTPVPELSRGELIRFSLAASATSTLGLLSVWLDRLLVGFFRTDVETGLYHAAAVSSVAFAVVLNAINAMFSPMIADLYHRGERDRLGRLFRVSTKWGLYLCLPLFLVLILHPALFMTAIFGAPYRDGAAVAAILAGGQLANLATGAVAHLLIMSGHQNRWLAIAAGSLLANVGLNLLWIPRYGILGAAAATAVAMAGMMLAGLLSVRQRLDLWPWDRRFLKGIVAAGAAAIALAGLRYWGPDAAPFAGLMITGAVVVGVYAATLALLGLDPEDRDVWHRVRARLRRGTAS